jgi:hypothetical protein
MRLLTIDNDKIKKSQDFGYLTVGIHLAPSSLSGNNACKWASKGCIAACLNSAGMGAFSTTQIARIAKTNYLFDRQSDFMAQLCKEIKSAQKKADKLGLKLAARLNLTSDIVWEAIPCDGFANIFEAFPSVQWYDYTKSLPRVMANKIANYHLTFSRSETSSSHLKCDIALANGFNVAIPFSTKKGEALPESYQGIPVIDGDLHDLRFLDGKSVVVGLRAKGKAKGEKSGFVVNV